MNDEYLAHYGVKGMKWGVRRYQGYDGTYTKKGMARYKNAEAKYNSAKRKYDSVKTSGDKAAISDAKRNVKAGKRSMNAAYKSLKFDYKADQGKQLYRQGKTIWANKAKNSFGKGAIAVGTSMLNVATANALNKKKAVLITKKYGTIPMSEISRSAINLGGMAAASLLEVKTRSDNSKLRAYYRRSGKAYN